MIAVKGKTQTSETSPQKIPTSTLENHAVFDSGGKSISNGVQTTGNPFSLHQNILVAADFITFVMYPLVNS